MAGQDLVRRGVRWKIGSGENVSVWNDAWLNYDNNFYIQTPHLTELETLKVSELLVPGTSLWNRDLVESILDEEDIVKVLRTPVAPVGCNDKLVWHFCRDGRYSVKSGYRLATALAFDPELEVEGEWRNLWRLKAPPRVKDSVWRMCRDCLPHRTNLHVKKITSDTSCVFCGQCPETSWHLFTECDFTVGCWVEADLWSNIDATIYQVDSLQELILRLLAGKDGAIIATILWQIWKERNAKLWEGRCKSAMEAIRAAKVFLKEWEELRATGSRRTMQPTCKAWHPPNEGEFKINVDAAFFKELFQTGVGMVLRDSSGTFIAGCTINFPGCVDVEVGEAMGFVEALSWAEQLDLGVIKVEGDAKLVTHAISPEQMMDTIFGDFIMKCKIILSCKPNLSVGFVKRDANSMAHALARASRFFESPYVWIDPPDFVVGLPSNNCSCNGIN